MPSKIGTLEINFIDKKTLWVAVVWSLSLLSPGAWQLYIHRIIVAIFILISWIVVAYLSNLLSAIQYILTKKLEMAKAIVNWQWYLNIPPIYIYAM